MVTKTPQKAPESLQAQVYRLAEEYHQDPALALKIIKCEGRMYNMAVNVNYDANGVAWSRDWGPWQINDYYHEKAALKMGLDIYDTEDNIRYGFILLSTQGTGPWKASQHCWTK